MCHNKIFLWKFPKSLIMNLYFDKCPENDQKMRASVKNEFEKFFSVLSRSLNVEIAQRWPTRLNWLIFLIEIQVSGASEFFSEEQKVKNRRKEQQRWRHKRSNTFGQTPSHLVTLTFYQKAWSSSANGERQNVFRRHQPSQVASDHPALVSYL